MLNVPEYVAVIALLLETKLKFTGLSSTIEGPVIVAVTLTVSFQPFMFVTFAMTVTVLFVSGNGLITCSPGTTVSSSGLNSIFRIGTSLFWHE